MCITLSHSFAAVPREKDNFTVVYTNVNISGYLVICTGLKPRIR